MSLDETKIKTTHNFVSGMKPVDSCESNHSLGSSAGGPFSDDLKFESRKPEIGQATQVAIYEK